MKLEYIPSHYKSYHTEFSVLRRNNLISYVKTDFISKWSAEAQKEYGN